MVSIIIVHYHADKELYTCLESIKQNKPRTNFEVIIVDNDEEIRIERELKRKFPWVKHVKSPGDIGFGAGNNLGVKHAKGKYLFFLNPDTRIFPGTVDELVGFIAKRMDVGIVAPMLLHEDGTPFLYQGCTLLTPLRGLVALSFINKYFPNNPISRRYRPVVNTDQVQEIDVAAGTAFLISKKLYDEIHGFDEHFFLYFEEFDLCKRVREKDYKVYIIPKSKIIHLHGKGGTNETKGINTIFKQSRFYYFKKHYGIFNALLVEGFTRVGKKML